MTSDDIELIRKSFGGVLSKGEAVGRAFYEELFRIAPEVRPMFSDDVGRQGKKLIDTVGLAVYALRSPGGPGAVLATLGRAHAAKHGVLPHHFEPVGRALLATLEKSLGDAFTPEMKSAWTRFYGVMSDAMIEAGRPAGG